jgi:single-strand DNA-binding protein
MAGSVNKVILIGNLTRDPEVRSTPSGQTVANMGLATNRTWKDRDGNRQEKAEFHNIVLWGRLAELAQQYLSKGRSVYIEGRLETSSWDDKQSGQKRYKTEVVGEEMTFLGGGEGRGGQQGGGYGGGQQGGGQQGGGQQGGYGGGGQQGGGYGGGQQGGGQQGGGYGGGQQGGGQQGGGQQGGGQQGGGYGGGQQGGGQQSDPPQQDGQSGSLPSFGGGASNPPAPAPSGGDPGFHDDDIPF